MGGRSAEREISLRTGRAVADALETEGFKVVRIVDTDDLVRELRAKRIDVAFLALHGKFGEDGTVQALLEYERIPYTGSGVLASALGMNKMRSRLLFEKAGLPTPRWFYLNGTSRGVPPADPPFAYPWVVKPNAEGSSLGVGVANSRPQAHEALRDAFAYGSTVLVEKFVPGREVSVGIVSDIPIGAVEVVQRGPFATFHTKYTPGEEEFHVPPRLSGRVLQRALEVGWAAHRAVGASYYSRVDLRVTEDGRPFILEINTLPGLTPTSWLPKIAERAGISYRGLARLILQSASLKVQ
ncbi:MAG: D-alanine--D-alanine ligase [Nitrospirae bacterium]|nr:D-alanine--D-alanine ligase [Nitrospirota bacterium]